MLPLSVKQEIMVEYLFWDIITTNQFFSNKTVRIDQEYLYEVCRGLQPRRFDSEDDHDKKIYLEDMEVHELYIIMQGFIGIGYSNIRFDEEQGPYKMAIR